MQRDLEVMQSALVPLVPAEVEGLTVSVAYRPADGPAAGGDFYDVLPLSEGKVAIILGDVAGHGRQALTHAALTRYTLRAYMQAGLDPRTALALAGRVLEDPTCEHYATVALAIFDTHTGQLTYSCAGHPPPIVRCLHPHEPLTLCASSPLGWRVPTGRRQTTISLPRGAIACFFTDGLIEARHGKDLLGRDRVSELLAALGPQPLAKDLLTRVQREADTAPDDMAACILRSSGPATYTHVEELEVDSRQLQAPATQRFLESCNANPTQIRKAFVQATQITAACGGALLRIDVHATATTVSVRTPHSPERTRSPSVHARRATQTVASSSRASRPAARR